MESQSSMPERAVKQKTLCPLKVRRLSMLGHSPISHCGGPDIFVVGVGVGVVMA